MTSARALALGNAYLCKADDAWAAFYNPAGLGTIRQPSIHLANFHIEGSKAYMDAVSSGNISELPGNISDSFEAQDLRSMLVGEEGSIAHLRANFFPHISARGMTLGYLYSQRNRAIIERPADGGEFEIAERRDHGPVFALNVPLFGGIIKLGASAVYLQRRELFKSFGASEAVTINESVDYKKGRGLQVTLGGRLTIPWTFLPTFSYVLRNSSQNDWEGIRAGGAPDKIKQTMDAGFSITPQIGKVTRVHLEVNWRDLANKYDTDTKRRVGLGMEIDFNRRLFMRFGSGDGWGSGGIGLRSRTFQFDLTTYAVDRSTDGFREEEDRRFVFSLSSGI